MAIARMFAIIAMLLFAFQGALAAPAPKKTPETTVPSVPQPTPWPLTAPKATTTAPSKPTPAPAEPLVRVLEGDLTLEVVDVAAFLHCKVSKSALQVSLANLLALARTQVEIVTMVAAEKGRRLKSGPGHVNVKYKITDPTKTVSPARVSSVAPMLPTSINNHQNALSQLGNTFVSTAKVPAPILRTTTTTTAAPVASDPCAAVSQPTLGWKAGLFKINKAGGKMVKSLYPSVTWLPAMLVVAVPALIGLFVLVRKGAQRRAATRSLGEGFAISASRDEECGVLECELTEEEASEAWD